MKNKPIIKDIGEVEGKLLVFGGVYSNLQALVALQQEVKNLGIPPSNIFCTGDVLGYCASPAECCAHIASWGINVILGNVEIQIRDDAEDCGCAFNEGSRCDIFSRQWFPYTQQNISQENRKWLEMLPDFVRFNYSGKRGIVVHGSFFETAEYIFQSSPWEKKASNFEACNADLIFSGHSGIPFAETFENRCWLNAGVIGMPANDGNTEVWYAVLEPQNSGQIAVTLHGLRYDFNTSATLMEQNNLPIQYANTLRTGVWDNCEILPAAETRQQGLPIVAKSRALIF